MTIGAEFQVKSFNVGLPVSVAHGNKTVETGIFKSAVDGEVLVSVTGPHGDGQADLVYHGGPDKAICVYFAEHYPYWAQELGRELDYGAFGENITLSGGSEQDLRIGDVLQIGSVTVQVSQPRQPCFKLGLRNDAPQMVQQAQTTGYTGFYLRVLEEGSIAAGNTAVVVDRAAHNMTIAEANRIYYTAKHDREEMLKLLAIEELAQSWKNTLQGRLDKLEAVGELL